MASARQPLILPVVVSTHGEICPGTVQLREWLVQQYRARLRLEGEREDGEKEDDLITSFRCELRAALLVATAKGTAEMLTVAGRPFRKGAAQGSSAWPGARAFAQRAAEDGAEDTAVGDSAPNEKEEGECSLVGDVDSDSSEGISRQSCNDSGAGTDVSQPTHPLRRSARLVAAADTSQARSLVPPLSFVICDGFPVVM